MLSLLVRLTGFFFFLMKQIGILASFAQSYTPSFWWFFPHMRDFGGGGGSWGGEREREKLQRNQSPPALFFFFKWRSGPEHQIHYLGQGQSTSVPCGVACELVSLIGSSVPGQPTLEPPINCWLRSHRHSPTVPLKTSETKATTDLSAGF